MTLKEGLHLVELLDEKLTRKDFVHANLGVSFSGYYQRMGGKTTPGCTKIQCITTVVEMLSGEFPQVRSNERANAWLKTKIPDWKDVQEELKIK